MHLAVVICWYVSATLNWSLNVLVDGKRIKRIMEGTAVLTIENSDYDVLRYFVWIGSGHNCETELPDFLSSLIGKEKGYSINIFGGINRAIGLICAPKPSNLRCTGALLTPFVVQTACHCVVYFQNRPGIEYPVPMTAEEEAFTVHPGRRLVEQIGQAGVYAKRFVIHPKCVKANHIVFHDYALIVVKDSLYRFQRNYAPTYSIVDLAKIWIETQTKKKMCLTIGFGSYEYTNKAKFERNYPLKSSYLRHAWMETLGYGECYNLFSERYIDFQNYTEKSSAICTIQPPQSRGTLISSTAKGDSGGPVTCDNEYVGIVSMSDFRYAEGLKGYGPPFGLDYHMATAFSVYENSYEYRDALHYRIFELYGPNDPLKDYVVTQLPDKTSKWIPQTRSQAGNKSYLRILLHSAIILYLIRIYG